MDDNKRKPKSERKCKMKGCKRPYRAKGYCTTHYKAWRAGELDKPRYRRCKKEGCSKPMTLRGFCAEHASKKKEAA